MIDRLYKTAELAVVGTALYVLLRLLGDPS